MVRISSLLLLCLLLFGCGNPNRDGYESFRAAVEERVATGAYVGRGTGVAGIPFDATVSFDAAEQNGYRSFYMSVHTKGKPAKFGDPGSEVWAHYFVGYEVKEGKLRPYRVSREIIWRSNGKQIVDKSDGAEQIEDLRAMGIIPD